ncbi:HNH endonuclease [Rhizobium sp. CNPSo 4039]|uniref:HNH endonuclease n=1 Tax=Rhizobium sp. CNPSo 4039 TaxID=3021409 RepID=UPI00254E548E|nr:HNH endonuclease [Rhizobium sp. CNPSo 4039]MDK4713275.1 HNH endonuclease [Rhizobium sp. CNPSo 4039]
MTEHTLDPQTLAAADFYDTHYAGAEPIFLTPGVRLFLGSAESPRHCRFCGKHEPEVTFKDEAHAMPAAFGNTGLFSNYECDACNHLFGEGIENHLGNWSKPMRTLSRIKGRNGVPTIKKPGPDKGWRVEYVDTGFQLKEYEDEPFFELDEQAKQLRFQLHRDTYIPVAALKGLVKIGLTLIPDVETQHFRETYDWIRDTDHSRNFVAEFPVFRTFIPGPMRNDLIVLMLMRRRATVDTVPYAFFTFAYGNEVLQVFLPSISQDQCINGKPLSLPPFPNPGTPDPVRHGRPRTKVEDLTGRQPVKGEKVPAVFGFDTITNTTPGQTGDEA